MRFGVQRRGVYVAPLLSDERSWLEAAMNREEVLRAFGYRTPIDKSLVEPRAGLQLGVIRRVSSPRRLGFVAVFPPRRDFPAAEMGYAIVHRGDRDAFTAIAAADAMNHYLFDHEGLPQLVWRTRSSNLPALAILRRLGYLAAGESRVDGDLYVFHRLTAEMWRQRRARLEVGERLRPSGLGGAFAQLEGPPWTPIQLGPR